MLRFSATHFLTLTQKLIINIGFSATLLGIGVTLNGCASTNPVQIGKNTYTLGSILRSTAYEDAAEHCKKLGLQMKPLSERLNRHKEFDALDYKCLNLMSKEYNNYTKPEVDPDVSIKVDKKVKYE